MRILAANKYNFIKGGSDRYFMDTARLLEAKGIEVARFCMQDSRNEPSPYQKYFVSGVDYDKKQALLGALRSGMRLLYNFEAQRKFAELLDVFKPDIVHIHNIYHQISPSILPAAKKAGVPVIMHLHDYKLISPNYNLFCHGKICEKGIAPHYFGCVAAKCVKDSYAKSFLAACEMHLHHTLLKIYENNVDLYIAPSAFMKEMCVRHGIPASKIEVLVNYAPPSSASESARPENAPLDPSDCILYAGRLSPEKGVDVLLRALVEVPELRLKIAGEGESEAESRRLTAELGLNGRVDFCGKLPVGELSRLMAACRALVLPSVWYENMPLVMLEALAQGRPVVASRIGGLPEIIRQGENGFLFTPGDASALGDSLRRLLTGDQAAFSAAARASAERFSADSHLERLTAIYRTYART